MRCAIYVRVSTREQDTAIQRKELTAYARARGWTIYRVFEDKLSGTSTRRPSFAEMMKDASARRFDVVLVWKLDRLARSLKDLVNTLAELSELGVAFVSLRDNLDLTTSSGRLMAGILGAFAQFEADIIRERVRAGIAHARSKGVRLGRPQKHDAVRIVKMRRSGLSYREIHRRTGTPLGCISRALKGERKSLSKTH